MKKQLSTLQELIALMDPQLYHHLDLTGSLNLFFVFRWCLIAFKREFKFDDVLVVWESLWSAPSSQFHLFLAMSILETHRAVIIRYLKEFDEVLKYVNELSQTMDPQPLISQAEILYLGFRNLVEISDRRRAERASAGNGIGAGAGQGAGGAGLRQRTNAKGKEKDVLVDAIKAEEEAEARVPDLALSDDLRALI